MVRAEGGIFEFCTSRLAENGISEIILRIVTRKK